MPIFYMIDLHEYQTGASGHFFGGNAPGPNEPFQEKGMKRFLTFFLLFCFLMSVAWASAQQTQQTQQANPKMVIEQPVYDAGSVYRGGA